MRVAIHQPHYWPWPPYLHKVMAADVFVYLDTVQFSKNGVQNRNQVRSPQGAVWLTLPVKQALGQVIGSVEVADRTSPDRHWKTLAANYARSPGFQRWKEELRELLHRPTTSLAEVAIASTEWMLEKLNVRTRRIRASQLDGVSGQASQRVASLCQALGATRYLTGSGALVYLREEDFTEVGCEVWVQHWTPMTYPQQYAATGFIPDLSALDLLLNCPDTAAELIARAGDWRGLARTA